MSGFPSLDGGDYRAVVIQAAGGPDVLQVERRPIPVAQGDEVLIKVAAAGVNRHDCIQRRAGPSFHASPVPGLEVAGTIVGVGAGVPASRLGQEVMALVQGGGYGEYVAAPSALAFPRPAALDPVEAAALPEALFTIWFNVFGLLALKAEETLLIHGGTSGVASVGMQVLRALGYSVLATCGSDEKCRKAEEFGARKAFRYTDDTLAEQVLEATGGRGVDAILDLSGGAHIEADIAMMAYGGRIAHLSGGRTGVLSVPLRALMAKQITVTGSLLRPLPLAKKAVLAEQIMTEACPLLTRMVRPPVAGVLSLSGAAEAHRRLESGDVIGKLVLRMSA